MKIKTNLKAGGDHQQHNQTIVRGLKIKTNIKAGDGRHGTGGPNHNQTLVCGLKVKSNVKAGGVIVFT